MEAGRPSRIGKSGRTGATGAVGPAPRVLWALVLAVLLLHLLWLLGMSAPLALRLSPNPPAPAVQIRVVQAVPAPVAKKSPPRARAAAKAAPAPAAPPPEPIPAQPVAETPPVPAVSEPPVAVVSEPAQTPTPPQMAEAASTQVAAALPLIAQGALPPSRLLSYQLTGMDKGLTYYASGELRWQHNGSAYDLTLSVRAFLIGSRHWRSVGQIDATGLVPRRFSDSWRNERAAHFDREQQRIVFSSNNTPAPLQPGAQDQVSLYVQLAAAMAGEPERFVPGTRLQVQTATIRDAVPWSLALQGSETLTVDGQDQTVQRWVCQPRDQYDAKVEFWVSPRYDWLPVRIRITQVSGSYIDLVLKGSDPLPPLPAG